MFDVQCWTFKGFKFNLEPGMGTLSILFEDTMQKRLVLIGAGHAHMVTLQNLQHFVEKGHAVTVIGPSEHHYYSGMGPGMLGKTYRPEEIRFAVKKMTESRGGTFVKGKAQRLDPERKIIFLEDGQEIPYDVASCNAGSYVPGLEGLDQSANIFTVKPIERLQQAQEQIVRMGMAGNGRIAIVGGGASSVEVAGNITALLEKHGLTGVSVQIFAGKGLLSRFPDWIGRHAEKSLVRRGVEVQKGSYVSGMADGEITLQSGETHPADLIFLARGVRPSRMFADSNLPTGPDGGLLVNRYLQCTEHPEIFGGGDCIYFEDDPLDKVGVYAVRQNPVLFANLMAALAGSPLQPFNPGGKYLLIFNLGDGTGILSKGVIRLTGKLAFTLKDYIDRKFMRAFQE